jgi:hypothetical protein
MRFMHPSNSHQKISAQPPDRFLEVSHGDKARGPCREGTFARPEPRGHSLRYRWIEGEHRALATPQQRFSRLQYPGRKLRRPSIRSRGDRQSAFRSVKPPTLVLFARTKDGCSLEIAERRSVRAINHHERATARALSEKAANLIPRRPVMGFRV